MRIIIHGIPQTSGPIAFEAVDAFYLGIRSGNNAPVVCSGDAAELVTLAALILRDLRQTFGEQAFEYAIRSALRDVQGRDISGDVLGRNG